MPEITQEYLKELFDYKDGNLYWKVNKAYHIKIGNKAGTISNGYYNIIINYKSYKAHRLIFLYHHGFLPKMIDHIDRNPSNNNIDNLREITKSQNGMNCKSTKNSTSKYKGVCWHKRDKIWTSQIYINKKLINLGSFKSEKAAAFIYNVYAREAFGEYACLNNLE